MSQDEVGANGWTSTPVDARAIFGNKSYINEPTPVAVKDIKFPSDDPVVAKTYEYVKERLHPKTLSHSMRVFYFGMVISQQQFPEQHAALDPSTWALACLLHDIGTADENLTATRMSFDLYGGIVARELLLSAAVGAARDQADAVAEAVIRHQDLGADGEIAYLGQLIQLATIYDNTGDHPRVAGFGQLVHYEARRAVNEAHSRRGWSECFAGTVRKEEEAKPWCHSTHIPDFPKLILGNELMKEWEE